MVGLTGSLTLVLSAINAATVTKEKVIALNLAREGIEAVRNIRDTNWLKYGANMRECWNWDENWDKSNNDDVDSPGCATGYKAERLIQPGYYRVDFDNTNYKWKLEKYTTVSNWTVDLWTTDMPLHIDTSRTGSGFYTHRSGASTRYQRRIKIGYLKDNGAVGNPADNTMEIASVVRYIHDSKIRTVALVTRISDYLNRKSKQD